MPVVGYVHDAYDIWEDWGHVVRNRIIYAVLLSIVIVVGLSSRFFSEYLPPIIGAYTGDVFWGLMVFLMVGFIFRNRFCSLFYNCIHNGALC